MKDCFKVHQSDEILSISQQQKEVSGSPLKQGLF
jgi:hypothetical protein